MHNYAAGRALRKSHLEVFLASILPETACDCIIMHVSCFRPGLDPMMMYIGPFKGLHPGRCIVYSATFSGNCGGVF